MLEFILGISFIILIIPILEGIRDLLLTLMEKFKSQLAIKIYENNKIINTPKEQSRAIGFVISEQDEEEEDND